MIRHRQRLLLGPLSTWLAHYHVYDPPEPRSSSIRSRESRLTNAAALHPVCVPVADTIVSARDDLFFDEQQEINRGDLRV